MCWTSCAPKLLARGAGATNRFVAGCDLDCVAGGAGATSIAINVAMQWPRPPSQVRCSTALQTAERSAVWVFGGQGCASPLKIRCGRTPGIFRRRQLKSTNGS